MIDDDAHDRHLREALRHAPDADVQPPAALSRLILDEARAKARDAQPVTDDAPPWAARMWAWLARPAVATGFAGVMAATLVGVMWWGQPMDEALPRRPAVVGTDIAAPAALPAPASATPREMAPPTVAAPVMEPQAAQRSRAPALKAIPPAAKPAPAEAPAAVAMPAPLPTAAPAPQPAASPPPAATADAVEAAQAGAAAQARSQAEERKALRSLAPAEAQRQRAAAKAELNEARLRQEAEAYTAIASVRAAVASDPTRWRWQRGDGAAQPMNDGVTAWLAQLDQAAGTRWQPRSAPDTGTPVGRALQLLRDGQVQHTLRLTEQGVSWESGQAAWQLALSPDRLAALQAALDSAAP